MKDLVNLLKLPSDPVATLTVMVRNKLTGNIKQRRGLREEWTRMLREGR